MVSARVERALILNKGSGLTLADFDIKPTAEKFKRHSSELKTLDEVVASYIRMVLSISGGKVDGKDGAAAILGVNESTLRHRMRRLGVARGPNKP